VILATCGSLIMIIELGSEGMVDVPTSTRENRLFRYTVHCATYHLELQVG
jgi:hypothetical protein